MSSAGGRADRRNTAADARQEWLRELARTQASWLNGGSSLWLTLAYFSWTDFPFPARPTWWDLFFWRRSARTCWTRFLASSATAAFIRFKNEIDASVFQFHETGRALLCAWINGATCTARRAYRVFTSMSSCDPQAVVILSLCVMATCFALNLVTWRTYAGPSVKLSKSATES